MGVDVSAPEWRRTAEGVRFTVTVPTAQEAQSLCDSMASGKWEMEIRPKRKRRSLDANALLWALLHDMAERIPDIEAEDLYREYIRRTNNFVIAEVDEARFAELERTWQSNGTGWLADRVDWVQRYHEEPKWVVRLYYGSSQYDTAQFSALVDSVLRDAEEMGIPYTNESYKALLEQYPEGQR